MREHGKHHILGKDIENRSGTCVSCGPVRLRRHQKGKIWTCPRAEKSRRSRARRGRPAYRKTVGPICERCGFVPEDLCQLDVDHRDGDHANDDPMNHQTLCANCHRLKSKREALERV